MIYIHIHQSFIITKLQIQPESKHFKQVLEKNTKVNYFVKKILIDFTFFFGAERLFFIYQKMKHFQKLGLTILLPTQK